MKKYTTYKPSGIDWIDDIPEHWKTSKVKWITLDHRQGYYSSKSYDDQGYRVVRITDINDDNSIEINNSPFYEIEQTDYERFGLKSGDFLFPRTGGVGRFGIFNSDIPSIYGSFLIRFRFSSELNHLFIKYYLSSNIFINEIQKEIHGGVNQNVHVENIKDCFIFFPNQLTEQHQIVNFLDEKTEIIDKLISTKERKIELLKEQRTSLINQVITKGLDPNVKMKDSGVEWIGEIPEHWKVSKLKYNGYFFSGFSFDSSDFISEGEIRVIKISNIQNNGISWEDLSFVPSEYYDTYINFRVVKGDLVFVLTRPIISTGIKICFYDEDYLTLLNQRNSVFRTNDNLLSKRFLYYIVRTSYFFQEFKLQLKETNQPNISTEQISNIKIYLPFLLEQQQIIEYLDKKTKEIDDLMSLEQKKIEVLKEYRQSLISEVITGKIDVRTNVN